METIRRSRGLDRPAQDPRLLTGHQSSSFVRAGQWWRAGVRPERSRVLRDSTLVGTGVAEVKRPGQIRRKSATGSMPASEPPEFVGAGQLDGADVGEVVFEIGVVAAIMEERIGGDEV